MVKIDETEQKQLLVVDSQELAAILSCGVTTAKHIAAAADAQVMIGHRVYYSVSKIETYLYENSV